MPLNPEIRYYLNGEEVDEGILNRPLTDIEANLNDLFNVTDGIPNYTAGDAGKYVRINATGTGFQYTDLVFVPIRKPEPVYPLEGTTNVPIQPNLEATAYAPIYSADSRNYRHFQMDYEGEDFSTPLRDHQVNADSWAVSPDISEYGNATFIWRCRDVSIKGDMSEWSDVQTFSSADAYVKTPDVTVEQDGTKALRAPIITGSTFEMFGAVDSHASTDWEVVRTSDSVVVWSSYTDTVNLESIKVPDQTLDINTEYRFRMRYNSTSYGSSIWVDITRTTVSYLVKLPILSYNDTGVEYDAHLVTITNYDNTLTYVISVSGGTYSRSADVITWTLPEVTQNTTHQLNLYAVNSYSEQSDTVTANVEVLNVPVIADDAYIVTYFRQAAYNNYWST